jgi:hypothetical protein
MHAHTAPLCPQGARQACLGVCTATPTVAVPIEGEQQKTVHCIGLPCVQERGGQATQDPLTSTVAKV